MSSKEEILKIRVPYRDKTDYVYILFLRLTKHEND